MVYGYLFIAIFAEVVATTALKSAEGFTRLWPSVIVVFGYGISFYFLSMTLKSMPVGIAYAIWSGVGVVLVMLVGLIAYRQTLDLAAVAGIGLILSGVLVINLLSDAAPH